MSTKITQKATQEQIKKIQSLAGEITDLAIEMCNPELYLIDDLDEVDEETLMNNIHYLTQVIAIADLRNTAFALGATTCMTNGEALIELAEKKEGDLKSMYLKLLFTVAEKFKTFADFADL